MSGAPGGDSESLWPTPTAAIAIAVADLAYVLTTRPAASSREFFVALSLGLAAAVLAVAFFTRNAHARAFLIVGAAFTGGAWVFLGALSYAIFLAPGVFAALIAADRATNDLRAVVSWAIVILAAGLAVSGTAAILAFT